MSADGSETMACWADAATGYNANAATATIEFAASRRQRVLFIAPHLRTSRGDVVAEKMRPRFDQAQTSQHQSAARLSATPCRRLGAELQASRRFIKTEMTYTIFDMADVRLAGDCWGMRLTPAMPGHGSRSSTVRDCSKCDAREWALVVGAVALLATGCAPRGFYSIADEPLAQRGGIGHRLSLEPAGECPPLGEEGNVVVLVHGIRGQTENVLEVRDVLAALEPAAMLSFHWSALEESKGLIRRLTEGLNHLVECTPRGRTIVVFAHSAGGVLASMAAAKVRIESGAGTELVVVTVASPLAGAGYSSWRLKLLPIKPFAITMSGKLERYTAPASGIRVVHVRTHAAGDHVMRETASGHRPNDPSAVVPGAILHDLPEHVGHDDALLWAARALTESPESFGIEDRRRAND